MSISTRTIDWMAGLLEGEGCFYFNRSTPSVILGMTDYDIVKRTADIWGVRPRGPQMRAGSKKDVWVTSIYGSDAAGWMMTLYPLLGERRRAKIRECLSAWKSTPVSQKHRTHCPQGHEYDAENTRYYKGRRHCRKCSVVHSTESRIRRNANRERTA